MATMTKTLQNLTELIPYGEKYDRKLPLKEITKMIRKELKPLIKLGFKFSVTTKDYSSIRITIKETGVLVLFNPHYDQQASWEFSVGKRNSFETGKDPRELWTEEGKQLGKYLKRIGNQWNYDNSDLMTDYHENHYFLFIMVGSTILS